MKKLLSQAGRGKWNNLEMYLIIVTVNEKKTHTCQTIGVFMSWLIVYRLPMLPVQVPKSSMALVLLNKY